MSAKNPVKLRETALHISKEVIIMKLTPLADNVLLKSHEAE